MYRSGTAEVGIVVDDRQKESSAAPGIAHGLKAIRMTLFMSDTDAVARGPVALERNVGLRGR